MNGMSAALGKLGAVVGAYLFGTVADLSDYTVVMYSCCALSLFGVVVTYYFIQGT